MPSASKAAANGKAPAWFPANLEEEGINLKLQNLFEKWHEAQPARTGVHVSSLITSDRAFCLRQIVLMQYFPHQPLKVHGRLLQIFLQGWVIHQKWQRLFQEVGKLCDIDTTDVEISRLRRGITFTPDIVCKIGKHTYIVEIKSMKGALYDGMRGVHADARIQAQMYMWLTGLDRAIILVENKDTQEFKFWVIRADPSSITKYTDRAKKARTHIRLFREDFHTLPNRHALCPSLDAAKAQSCPVGAVCFAGRLEREKLARRLQRAKAAKVA
jgi:hypothetical protein